jgi:Tfp pilus assembly protein PilF
MKSTLLGLFLLSCGAPAPERQEPRLPVDPLAAPADTQPASPLRESAAPPEVAAGIKLLESGDAKGAQAQFSAALAKAPKSADAHYYLALSLDKQGEKAKAEAEYQEALRAKPDHEAAAVNLSAGYIDASKFNEALQVCQTALSALRKSGQLSLNAGVALASMGRDADAEKAFSEASATLPKDPMVALTHGMWLGKWKKLDGAKARLVAARDLAAGDVGVLASAGFELKNVGAFGECIVALDRALEKKDAAELRTYRALCKMGQADKPGALADLETAVKNEPKYAPAHFYLAGQLLNQKRKADAIAHYTEYVKLEPQGPLAAAAQERIKILKKSK